MVISSGCRILIDYRGPTPAQNVNAVIAAEGYFGGQTFFGAAMHIGLPGIAPYVPLQLPGSSAEIWSTNNPQFLTQNPVSGWAYSEWALPTMTLSSLQFTVQVVWFLSAPLACDASAQSPIVASPGIVIDY